MEHREGKEAQHVTVVALVDCHFFFVSQNEREREKKEIEEIRLVLHTIFSIYIYISMYLTCLEQSRQL